MPGDKEPPKGYVRVTFKIDDKHKGGVFEDKDGKKVTELHYDVIKGLKSDNLPHPIIWEDGKDDQGKPKVKEANRYYITPDQGKTFKDWDNEKWLNKETLINRDYTFTAYFDWSGLTSSGLVRTEAFKGVDGKWVNNFAPTIDDLKKQLVWKEKDEVKKIPEGTDIQLVYKDDAGKETALNSDEDIYNLVKEMNVEDKDQTVRVLNIVAKVKFKDGKAVQELPIPITVYKNVYEALNKEGDKPIYLTDAEGKEAKDGGLKDILKDNTDNRYIKVTVKPNKDFDNKDNKVYYVNPNAWVEIPKVESTGDSRFTNWTADIADYNEESKANGVFDFGKRHKFTKDTVITPVGADDVVEQEKGKDKPDVPKTYVKVIVKTTDKATDETKFEKTFWVNPKADVTINVTNPKGKKVEADATKPGTVGYQMDFAKWQSEEDTPRTWGDKIVGKFEKDTTIVAKYSVEFEKIKDLTPKTDTVPTPQGKTPTVDQIKEKITPPEGKTIKEVKIVKDPDVNTPGDSKVQVIVEYTDGSSVGTDDNPIEVPVKVHEPIVKGNPDGSKPKDALANYVKVIFKAGEGGKLDKTLTGNFTYYVSPEVEVDMTKAANAITATPSTGYAANGAKWINEDGKNLKDTFTKDETIFKLNFVKSKDIVEKTDDSVKKPEGYVTVKFTAGENGEVVGGNKTYFVNPDANIKLVDKDKATGATNELVVPEAKANDNYSFKGWAEKIDYTNPIKGDREYVAKFTKNDITLTYDAGGGKGTVPSVQKTSHGGTVILAKADGLTKADAVFAGWKLDGEEKIYQPGDSVKLEKARTATAQWKPVEHKVDFDTQGGTPVPSSQEVQYGGKLFKDKVTDPKKDGFVFLGWKEKGKENEEAFFNLDSKIVEDKTLVAQWEKAVQPIDEKTTVDQEKFIKVTFKQGDHGKLKLADAEQEKPVIYKVAKTDSFEDAVKHGLVVPGIAPAKYYKAKEANGGWDQALALNKQDITFIAQYEYESNVIPVDPTKPNEELKKDMPDGMVLVDFKVPEDKAFMTGDTKFYVKKSELVNIEAPVVHPLTLENGQVNNYEFKGWKLITDGTEKVSFTKDTTIDDSPAEKPDIRIRNPRPKAKMIFIQELTADAKGYLEVIRDGNTTTIEASKRGKRFVFNLSSLEGGCVKANDLIKFYAEKDGIRSDVREYRVR